jgi:hypothetical protein
MPTRQDVRMNTSFHVFGATILVLGGCSSDVEPDSPTGSASSASTGDDTGASSTSSTGATSSAGGSGASTGGNGGQATGGAASGGAGGEGGDGTGGAGGMLSPTCQALSLVAISMPVVHDAGGDGTWSPGESADVTVVLTNTSPQDNLDYPGVSISSDHPEVTSSGRNFFFGLLGNQSAEIPVGFLAGAAVPSGTVVHFVATVTNVSHECAGMDSIAFEATID